MVAMPFLLSLSALGSMNNISTEGKAMKESNTIFDGTYFKYTCPHCGMKSGDESADPKKNPHPFSYMPSCMGCGELKTPDYDVIEAGHAAFASTRR